MGVFGLQQVEAGQGWKNAIKVDGKKILRNFFGSWRATSEHISKIWLHVFSSTLIMAAKN
jgi:hypothetical protein